MSDTEQVVLEVLRQVAEERSIDSGAIQLHHNLVDIGFKSIDLARITALLELRLEVDPFVRCPITDIRTVGDLCKVYENELTGTASGDASLRDTEQGKPTRTPLGSSADQRRKKARSQRWG